MAVKSTKVWTGEGAVIAMDVKPGIVSSVHRVEHPPTWRGKPFALHFLLLNAEPTGDELLGAYRWAVRQSFPNPRAISPQTLQWSSLFQPRFHEAMRRQYPTAGLKGLRLVGSSDDRYTQGLPSLRDLRERTRFWLQSVMFLAGVTLSAAIVQGRWSTGTLGSKFDRLWMAGELAQAGVVPELAELDLHQRVRSLAADHGAPGLERLLAVRSLFEAVVERLAAGVQAQRVHMRCPPSHDIRLARFGFVEGLRRQLPGLRAVIVYGSSVSSENFADFDAVLVVDDPVETLRRLHDTRPQWSGKELNLGIYAPRELWAMQLLSGDNLADYGLCVHGEAELPEKPVALLLARNLSFGMVRERQQLGMISHALRGARADGDDRRNLYHYFVKIPSNIAKGTFGAVGTLRSKDEIHRWLAQCCGFDTVIEQERALADEAAAALSRSAVATGAVLRCLNEELRVVEPA